MTTETPPPLQPPPGDAAVAAATRRWVEQAVIGLNLCPFAKAVLVRDRVRFVVTEAADADTLLDALEAELHALAAADPQVVDTALLIHPRAFADFLDFHFFQAEVEALVDRLGYRGVFQVAAFHPQWVFAGSAEEDIGNAVNRAPYPTLHLLREDSVTRAVAAFPDAEAIYGTNQRTLVALGWAGWKKLLG